MKSCAASSEFNYSNHSSHYPLLEVSQGTTLLTDTMLGKWRWDQHRNWTWLQMITKWPGYCTVTCGMESSYANTFPPCLEVYVGRSELCIPAKVSAVILNTLGHTHILHTEPQNFGPFTLQANTTEYLGTSISISKRLP